MTEKDAGLIKKPLLIPIGVGLVLLILISFASVFWMQQANSKEHIHSHLGLAKQLFDGMLDKDARHINSIIDFYAHNENLQNAFLSQNREKLLAAVLPLFQDIRAKYEITHFYFINPERVCFLRVHNPPRHGDYIGRYTMDQAAHTGLASHGIELGPYGTFTLRIVRPWRVGDELIGYIELGREIEHITPAIKKLLDLDLLLFIDKSFLKRDKWEEGLTMMGRADTTHWDQFPNSVLIDNTMPKVPSETGRLISHHLKDHEKPLVKLNAGNRRYKGGFISLLDAGGNEVGDILALHDVTDETSQLSILLFIMLITLATGGMLFFLFNRYTGRLQDRLMASFDDLDHEIEERKTIQKELQESEEHLKTILNGLPSAVVLIDAETHTIIDVNPAAEKMIAAPRNKIVGNICHNFICPAVQDECPITDLGQQLDRSERELLKATGEQIPILKTAVTIKLQNGIHLLESFIDISELKRIEAELKKHKDNLEELVNKRTDELIQSKELLETSLQEKETLLKEIHHRVKNNMQVVSSLLKLQSRKLKDKKTINILQDSQNRIRAMSLIHENIYRSENLAKIKFSGYIMDLTTSLFTLYKTSTSNISLHVDSSDDAMLDIDTAIPCALIVNELVTNSLKYGFPQGQYGEIRILLNQTGEDELTLMVSDNGIGIPEDIDFKNTESLGLHLVTMLAEDQLDGEISLERTSGTEFKIRFRRRA